MSAHAPFNKLHRRARGLAARFDSPTFVPLPGPFTSDQSGGQKTSSALSSPPASSTTPPSSTAPTSAQQTTIISSSSSSSSSSSVTSTSSVLSSSATSSSTLPTSTSIITTTSSSISSSIALHTPLSTVSTPVVVVPSTYIATGVTIAPSSTTSAASSTPSSSGSINTTAVVGGIAGSLVGLAVIGFLVMWCLRRKRKNDEDEWSAAAFKRQSAILVDDPPEPQPSYNPRPPTMIERHNASPALAVQRNHPQDFYGGYGQQAAYGPGEVTRGGSPPSMQPHGYAPREDPSQLTRQPSSGAYLSRQPAPAGYDIPNDPYAHYVDLNRSSVTPFQAAQYADISRQLSGDPNSAVALRKSLDAARLPSPFDEEVDPVHDAAPRAPSPAHVTTSPTANNSAVSTTGPAPAPRGREITNVKRPDTVYTMYDEGDAYDGF